MTTASADSPKKPRKRKPKSESAPKKEPRPDPTTGQSGPRIELDPAVTRKEVDKLDMYQRETLSDKERRVFDALKGGAKTLTELAEVAFSSKSKKQGNSWVRNSLRRLVCARLVKRVDRGTYKRV
jgi:hypothetical protein